MKKKKKNTKSTIKDTNIPNTIYLLYYDKRSLLVSFTQSRKMYTYSKENSKPKTSYTHTYSQRDKR